MTTQVAPCKCKHTAQDDFYGKGNRLWNWGDKVTQTGGWRCTVCGATRPGKIAPIAIEKEQPK